MENRRKIERFEMTAPARVIFKSQNGERKQLELTTKDISSGGALLRGSQPLAEGARVSMELVLSLEMLRKLSGKTGATIRVRGRVIRVDERGVAVRFESSYRIMPLLNGNPRARDY